MQLLSLCSTLLRLVGMHDELIQAPADWTHFIQLHSQPPLSCFWLIRFCYLSLQLYFDGLDNPVHVHRLKFKRRQMTYKCPHAGQDVSRLPDSSKSSHLCSGSQPNVNSQFSSFLLTLFFLMWCCFKTHTWDSVGFLLLSQSHLNCTSAPQDIICNHLIKQTTNKKLKSNLISLPEYENIFKRPFRMWYLCSNKMCCIINVNCESIVYYWLCNPHRMQIVPTRKKDENILIIISFIAGLMFW